MEGGVKLQIWRKKRAWHDFLVPWRPHGWRLLVTLLARRFPTSDAFFRDLHELRLAESSLGDTSASSRLARMAGQAKPLGGRRLRGGGFQEFSVCGRGVIDLMVTAFLGRRAGKERRLGWSVTSRG